MMSWRRSGWNSCVSWCLRPLVLPCWSTRPTSGMHRVALADLELAARAQGLQIQALNASTSREIDAAFATLLRERPDALFVSGEGSSPADVSKWSNWRRCTRSPRLFANREFAEVGGLMSYGTNIADAWRQAGVYTGRILKGAKPADLPVVQATKFELVINAQDGPDARPHRAADAARRAPTR